jgi:RsiW-degrading membrane proteinase PrsW (M82 family)
LAVTYLLLTYSVVLGLLWIGLLVLVIAIVRRTRGTQTGLEQQAFQRASHYKDSAQRAYEEGKHREIAQSAYQQSRKAYEETQTRVRQWSEAQAAERQRNETLRAIERERDVRRERFDRYVTFFERARAGAQTSLEWWRAYEEDEQAGEGERTTADLLLSARDRAEAGLHKMGGFEERFSGLLQANSLAEADDFLDHQLASQEDFEGGESVFPPLVAAHDRTKHAEDWTNYRRELERFIKDLEDLLGSPTIRTAPANRLRFPDPRQARPKGFSVLDTRNPYASEDSGHTSCRDCGAQNAPQSSFCQNCGNSLQPDVPTSEPMSNEGTLPNVPALPPVHARNNERYLMWGLGAAGVLFMSLLGLLFVTYLALRVTGVGPTLIGMMIAMLPVPFYIATVVSIDRYKKKPVWALAGAFFWGATISAFFALSFNNMSGEITGVLFGGAAGGFFTGVVIAPIAEEVSKAVVLFVLFFWLKDKFDNVIDGIVYAAMVGLGFAMAENFLYYGGALAQGGLGMGLLTFILRGLAAPFMHPLFTAMTGIGLGLARQSRNDFLQVGAPFAGLLAAITLHGLWNFLHSVVDPLIMAQLATAPFAVALVLMFLIAFLESSPLLFGVAAVVFFELRREGRIIRQYLTPELQSGVLTQREYQQLGSIGGRFTSSIRVLRAGSFDGWRAYTRFNQTATDLAFYRDRVSRAVTSVDTAGREAAYVQALRQLKGVGPPGS